MIIGLTIVAMGSSAPEIVVSVIASVNDKTNTAIGNAIGSNIANIALVLGITALIRPIQVRSLTVKRELPILLCVTGGAIHLLLDYELSRLDGIILLSLLVLFIGLMLVLAWHSSQSDPLVDEQEAELSATITSQKATLWIIVGLVLLPLSAKYMVDSAVNIAHMLGVSDLVIGLTILAIGTSLPELAASIAGVLKKEDELALGNIIGSNTFNLLAVLSMPGLIAPGLVDDNAVSRDIWVMAALTLMLFVFSFNFRGTRRINRWEAGILCISFVLYQWWLFK